MSELKGRPGELRATLVITRKATGKKETFELVGSTDTEQQQESLKKTEQDDGSNP